MLSVPFLWTFNRGIPTIKQMNNITLCPTDHLHFHHQAQAICKLQDLEDIKEHFIMADEVTVCDHDGWKR